MGQVYGVFVTPRVVVIPHTLLNYKIWIVLYLLGLCAFWLLLIGVFLNTFRARGLRLLITLVFILA